MIHQLVDGLWLSCIKTSDGTWERRKVGYSMGRALEP